VTDGTIALLGALALFVIPRQDFFRPQPPQPTQQRAAAAAHARLRTQEEEEEDEDEDGDHDHAASSTAMHHARSGLRSRANSAASSITRRSTVAGAAASGSNNNAAPEPFGVLPWELVLQRMPWDVLFLVGSGLSLSLAFKESKLSRMIATDLSGVADVPFPFVVFSVIVVVILVSNFISNVACANIVLPPLGCIAVHLGRYAL
jgi:hypothetical protein